MGVSECKPEHKFWCDQFVPGQEPFNEVSLPSFNTPSLGNGISGESRAGPLPGNLVFKLRCVLSENDADMHETSISIAAAYLTSSILIWSFIHLTQYNPHLVMVPLSPLYTTALPPATSLTFRGMTVSYFATSNNQFNGELSGAAFDTSAVNISSPDQPTNFSAFKYNSGVSSGKPIVWDHQHNSWGSQWGNISTIIWD